MASVWYLVLVIASAGNDGVTFYRFETLAACEAARIEFEERRAAFGEHRAASACVGWES